MKTLDEIMIEAQSDKASVFTRTYAQPHNYCVHLERFFAPIRNDTLKLAEIGVGGGESIRGWLEFFPNAQVYGIDIVSNTNPYNTRDAKPHERYTFIPGDQSNAVFWASFIKMHGGDWDVVDDDGSHQVDDMKTSFTCLWPHVKPSGMYVIEDISLLSEYWTSAFVSQIHADTVGIDSIYFARELCVMRKK